MPSLTRRRYNDGGHRETWLVDQTVMISLLGGATVTPRAMQNLSVLGAGILLKDTPIPSTDFDLSFDQFRTSLACRLVWHRDAFAGVEFVH
jgi:hypothetical protein